MMSVIRSGLLIPLVLVAMLAAVLGFVVTREIAPDAPTTSARLSVVALPSEPTPSPEPTPETEETSPPSGGGDGRSSGRSRSSTRDPRCPSGCECTFPTGGIVIICR
jgi:hypothetical protein